MHTVAIIHNPLFAIGLLLIGGYFTGKFLAKIGLPEVTGFLIAGIFLGESFLGFIPHHMNNLLKGITEIALSLIAITIGGEFYLTKLKRLGEKVVIITVVQIAVTFGLVSIALYLFGMDISFAMLLGAIASATAPAATVAIVQALRAYGSFVDYLYGVVALDDAGAVVLFGVIFAFVSNILTPSTVSFSAINIVFIAVFEVLVSLIIGGLFGFLLHIITRKIGNNNELLIISLSLVLITTAISIVFHLSHLLTNMALGAVLINLSPRNHRIFKELERLSPPIYALFFIIAGTELNPKIILNKNILLLGFVYILFRMVGKYYGVYIGCSISKTTTSIKKYLGYCMFPQAGVALGLVLLIQTSPIISVLSETNRIIVDNMVNIILLSVFVNELIGPPISKYGIIKGNQME